MKLLISVSNHLSKLSLIGLQWQMGNKLPWGFSFLTQDCTVNLRRSKVNRSLGNILSHAITALAFEMNIWIQQKNFLNNLSSSTRASLIRYQYTFFSILNPSGFYWVCNYSKCKTLMSFAEFLYHQTHNHLFKNNYVRFSLILGMSLELFNL